MHEKIRMANRARVCDLCGQMIHPGERYRAVRDEYSPIEYCEHIRCPGAPTAAIADLRPTPPEIRTNANNRAFCMA